MRAIPTRVWPCAALLILATGLTSAAAPEASKKADVTGTWKWNYTTPNGQAVESTLTLKQDGDKLTGTLAGRRGGEAEIRNAGEAEIKEGKVDGDEVSFQIMRERNGRMMTQKYKGKLEGDTIKGKVEVNFNGQDRSRDWEAKRS